MMITKKKTPFFVIDKEILDDNIKKLKTALNEAWPNYIIGYSYKTNSLLWIIDHLKNAGCYAEVVSDDEYQLAKSIGHDNIVYNGIAKSKETFLKAVRDHNIVNIDSTYEIDWLDELKGEDCEVGIRVNFDLESKCPGQTQCGTDGERFGFCYENGDLKKAMDAINSKGVSITGLHLHKSSKTRMPCIYSAIAETAVEIAQKYELKLKYVDIGGGFFGGLETKPQFNEYFDMIAEILRQQFDPASTALIVEPGMALIGSAIDYVTTVTDIKATTRNTFVVTDGSRIHIDPLMTKTSYFYDIIHKTDAARQHMSRQVICGFTCMEHDRLFEIADSEELAAGDRIIYHKVGAYTMCLSPLFIKVFPDIYVKDKDTMRIVREKWSFSDYKRNCYGEE